MPQVCLPISKHHPDGPRQASKIKRGADHDHTLLGRSELDLRDNVPSNRAAKKVWTITVAPMECNIQGSNPKGHGKHPIDCLEAHITICTNSGIREEIARKVTDYWTKETSRTASRCLNSVFLFHYRRELPILNICVNNLVEHLVYFQVTHAYTYPTLCIHASAICSINSSLPNRQGPQQHP